MLQNKKSLQVVHLIVYLIFLRNNYSKNPLWIPEDIWRIRLAVWPLNWCLQFRSNICDDVLYSRFKTEQALLFTSPTKAWHIGLHNSRACEMRSVYHVLRHMFGQTHCCPLYKLRMTEDRFLAPCEAYCCHLEASEGLYIHTNELTSCWCFSKRPLCPVLLNLFTDTQPVRVCLDRFIHFRPCLQLMWQL